MRVLRLLSGILLLISLIALAHDATRMPAGQGLAWTSLGEHWTKLAPASFNAAQSVVQRYTHPLVWDPTIRTFLRLPTWPVIGTLGALTAFIGRRKRRVNIFAN
jgi:hypothetical protein